MFENLGAERKSEKIAIRYNDISWMNHTYDGCFFLVVSPFFNVSDGREDRNEKQPI